MRKLLVSLLAVAAISFAARADVYTAVIGVTNSVVTTNAVNASGWLDKIEISGPNVSAGSYSIIIGTYDAGVTGSVNPTIIDTYATLSGLTTSSTVVRPRVVGTTTAGVAITAVTGSGSTNVTTVLMAPYDRICMGGNTIIKLTPASCTAGGNVTVSFYYTKPSSILVP